MKTQKKGVSLSIDKDILIEIKILAEQDSRPLSQYINVTIREFLKDIDESDKNNLKEDQKYDIPCT